MQTFHLHLIRIILNLHSKVIEFQMVDAPVLEVY